MKDLKDKQLGMLYGLAVGDAIGSSREFKARDSFPPVTGYEGNVFGGPPGEWTDDTSMAVALAHSLAGGFDLHDQLRHYTAWRRGDRKYHPRGCIDIGGQTSSAIGLWNQHGCIGDARLMAESQSGNGSIMRLAPVVARYLGLPEDPHDEIEFINVEAWGVLADLCGLSSVPTHPNSRCVTACQVLGVLCAGLAWGLSRKDVLKDYRLVDIFALRHADPLIRAMWEERTFLAKGRSEIRSSGYVLDTLEAALWAFYGTDSFEAAVLTAANLGHDADTVACVTAQIAGSYYGWRGIPQSLKDGLGGRECLDAAFLPLIGLRELPEPVSE